MAIANGTCVSFCNQPKAQFGYTSGESRRYIDAFTRFAGGGIWLPQESHKGTFWLPGYAPGTIAINVTWMERGFNGCMLAAYTHLPSTISEIQRYIGGE